MPGPRLLLHFGGESCSPLNCTQRDNLINSIINLDFQQDGFDSTMSCAQSSSSYTLMCRNKYNDLVVPSSSNSIETSGLSDQIIWMAILICVIVIVLLILNTMRLVRKVKKYENRERSYKEDHENENELEIVKILPQ
jgi:tetrahydromethanopterin S-methyltransferase subunit E